MEDYCFIWRVQMEHVFFFIWRVQMEHACFIWGVQMQDACCCFFTDVKTTSVWAPKVVESPPTIEMVQERAPWGCAINASINTTATIIVTTSL
jgi:hypothetical protein